MAATYTLTLNGTARLPFSSMTATSGVSKVTTSGLLLINSGACALIPKSTSGFTAYKISCMGTIGTGKGKGFIGVDKKGGQGGVITAGTGGASTIAVGMADVEYYKTSGASGTLTLVRSSSNTVVLYEGIRATGGATQGLVATNALTGFGGSL